jgi:hypothetical protein
VNVMLNIEIESALIFGCKLRQDHSCAHYMSLVLITECDHVAVREWGHLFICCALI